MNVSHVLHRQTGASQPDPATLGGDPSLPTGPIGDATVSPPWPTRARGLVALLVVAVVVATIAAVVGARDDRSAEVLLEQQVADLTAERNAALERVSALDDRVAELTDQVAAAEAAGAEQAGTADRLRAELAAVGEARDAALADAADLTVERDAALARVSTLTGDLDELRAQVADLDGDVADLESRLATAVKERDAARRTATSSFDVTLVGAQLAATYTTKVTDAAGVAPKFTKATITTTKEGWLRLSIPGVAEGALTMIDGSLHFVAGSTTAFGPCDGVARTADVVLTISPASYTVSSSGVQRTGLHGVLTAQAPATGSCAAALAMANVDFTR